MKTMKKKILRPSMKKKTKDDTVLYLIYEVTPIPQGNTYRLIVARDTYEDIMMVYTVLKETDINYSLYEIWDTLGKRHKVKRDKV